MMTLFYKRLKALVLGSLMALATPALAGESITSHDIWIQMEKNRSVTVTEIITVEALNNKIGDGIVRYVDSSSVLGGKATVNLLSALRDDAPTRAITGEGSGAARIELGWPAAPTRKPGTTTYKLRYNITEQINTAGHHDRISLESLMGLWPVPTEKIRIRVTLPEGFSPASWYAKIGNAITHDGVVELEKLDTHKIAISVKRPLKALEASGIGVAWAEGAVTSPTLKDIASGWFHTAPAATSIALSYLALAVFIFFASVFLERKTDKAMLGGRSFTLKSLSPAALRVFAKRHIDRRGFISVILSMAAKGHLEIIDNPGSVVLRRNSEADYIPDLTAEELALDEGLFHSGSRVEVKLDRFNSGLIESACRDAEWILREYTGPRFWQNSYGVFYAATILGIIGTAVSLHFAQVLNVDPYKMAAVLAVFGLIFVGCGNTMVEMSHTAKITGWRDALRHGRGALAMGGVITALAGLGYYTSTYVGWLSAAGFIGLFLLALGFHTAFHGPTAEGRLLMEEGRRYRKAMAHPRRVGKNEETLQAARLMFERGMGASYALGAERMWRHAFRDAFKDDTHFPAWYKGYEFDPHKLEDRLNQQLNESKVSF